MVTGKKQLLPSYGAAFSDPEYLQQLTQQAPAMSEKEFLKKIMEGVYFFRLPLVAFMGMANTLETAKDKELVLEQHQAIFRESQLLLNHLENLMRFVKAYQQKKVSES